MAKLFFYDIETTGVKFWKNGIHQISGAIEIDGEVKEKFNFKVKPVTGAIIEKEALEIGGVTEDQVMQYPDMNSVYSDIVKMLAKYVDKFNKKDKFHLVGYNINSFDNQFFRAFFTQCGDAYFGSWFWADSVDCYVLASKHFMNERSTFENFKQSTVAKRLGIEIDDKNLHDAEYDIWVCMEIYRCLNGL